MFDCAPSLEDRIVERKLKVDAIRQFEIIHRCCCCGKELETHWDEIHQLDGRWMALETEFSEIFNCFVAWPHRVLCNWCFGSGEWKKKGVRWK